MPTLPGATEQPLHCQ